MHSKLHTEEDSDEYKEVHELNNRKRYSKFLVSDDNTSYMLPKFSGKHLNLTSTDSSEYVRQGVAKLL